MNDELRARIFANDRLLKALLTLLVIRDPHLLEDIESVFALARTENSDVAALSAKGWEHLRQEIEMVRRLAETHEPIYQ
jgi:hypothetical protein